MFITEEEHKAFSRANCSLADWKSGAHAERQREKAIADSARSSEQLDRDVEQRLEGVRDLVAFKAFEDQVRDEIAELQAAEEKLERTLDAPGGTESSIRDGITRSARKLLAGLGLLAAEPETSEDTVDPAQLEARWAAERRAAAVATEALGLVREKLAVARQRLEMLEGRRCLYLDPAMKEIAEPLGHRLVRALNELREVYSLLGAYYETANIHTPKGAYDGMRFHRPNFDSISAIPEHKFSISIDAAHRQYWRNTEASLRTNPSARIALPTRG
jgi:hypothetical protein